ncbi:MAG: hypothetical protein IJO64_00635 [Clostridia bacterium]|nr:hypothetical protein [Clostridia bacterium]
MISFTVFAFELVLWQSSDISVSIVSNADVDGNGDVSISVLNTAGSTLLFYENPEMSGKIEYLSDDGWVEYCDISYTADNTDAISQQYGGLFAELDPGESWEVSVPEEAIEGMQNGTYRIKMTYITAKKFKQYIDNAFENRDLENSESSEISVDESIDISEASTDKVIHSMNNSVAEGEKESVIEEEDFLAESLSEVFVKTFDFSGSEDIVSAISIEGNDDSEAENNARIKSRSIPRNKRGVLPE